jgi:hypothetical protein
MTSLGDAKNAAIVSDCDIVNPASPSTHGGTPPGYLSAEGDSGTDIETLNGAISSHGFFPVQQRDDHDGDLVTAAVSLPLPPFIP